MRGVHELRGGNFNFLVPVGAVNLDAQDGVWIPVAEVGEWYNPRHGNVPITKEHLRVMLANYKNRRHPLRDVQLPVDYDHLSTQPNKKPGDGEAAGWFTDLELRADGAELWGRVDWTDEAKEKIKAKKYKYFSPTFNPNWHALDNGDSIGTALIGGALTNYPTLPGCVITCSIEPATEQSAQSALTIRRTPHTDLASGEDISFSERERRVYEAINAKYPLAYKDGAPDWNSMVNVRDVFEDRVIFSKGAKLYRLAYQFNDDLSVTFEGEPIEVIYSDTVVTASFQGSTMKLKDAKGNEVDIPDANIHGAIGSFTLDALATHNPAVKEAVEKSKKAPESDPDVEAQLKTLSTEVNSLKKTNETLTAERDQERTRALDQELISLQAGGWVTPAEAESMKELATSNRALFDKMIAAKKATGKPAVTLNTVHGTGGNGTNASAVVQFDALIAQYRKDNPTSDHATAIKAVAASNRELAAARNVELAMPIGPGGLAMTTN